MVSEPYEPSEHLSSRKGHGCLLPRQRLRREPLSSKDFTVFSSSLFLYIQTRIYWVSPPSEWTFTFLPRPCSTVPKWPLVQQCAWPEALREDMAFLCVSNARASPGGAGGRVRKKKVQTRTKKTGPSLPPAAEFPACSMVENSA